MTTIQKGTAAEQKARKTHKSHSKKPKAPAPQETASRPAWQLIVELGQQIPDEQWAKVPKDFSITYRHYLSGRPEHDE